MTAQVSIESLSQQLSDFLKDTFKYPEGYEGQALNDPFVFVSDVNCKYLRSKRQTANHYLQRLAKEVAAKTERATQYLRAYPTGERFLWKFDSEDVVLLSLVVLLPIGPRPVVWIGKPDGLLDTNGNSLNHAELCTLWSIERSVGTSTHPFE
jgi:hypothetical protein